VGQKVYVNGQSKVNKLTSDLRSGRLPLTRRSFLREKFNIDVSPKFVSSVCESITDGVQEWRAMPLRAVWPVLCLDAFSSKLVTTGESEGPTLHVAVGVSLEGRKELPGL
jgi:putative transposase